MMRLLWTYFQTRFLRRFRSRQQLERWQEKRLRVLLRYVLPRSSYYQELYTGSWRTMPLTDKAAMMEHFDRLNTAEIKKANAFELALTAEESRDFDPCIGDVAVGLSSGTSGSRGLFLASEAERTAWAGTILAKVLPRSLLGQHRVALFLRANSKLYTAVRKGRIQFEYFDLLCSVDDNCTRLEQFRPTLIVAPPSMLRMLAQRIESRGLQLSPEKIASCAEVLDPLDEAYISRHFALPVHQIYQCTEGFLACTCPYGTLHLNEDLAIIEKEYIDVEAGKFMPIITDLFRHTQPVLRYRLNDILTESRTPCPCGSVFTALEHIEGRCDDMFYGKGAEGLQPIFPDYVRRAILRVSDDIRDYAVIQDSPNQLRFHIEIDRASREQRQGQVIDSLQHLFQCLGCQIPQVDAMEKPQYLPGQKLRRVHRDYEPDAIFE